MDPKARQAKRARLTANGTYVTHSEIMGRRGAKNIVSFRNFGVNDTVTIDGGRGVILADTPAYKSYVFYMAPRTSIGKKQIETGNKTVVVNTGLLFITIEKKGPGRSTKYTGTTAQYSAGHVFTLKKGQRYTYSTGNAEAELMITEGGDLTEKTLEEPVANLDGSQQFKLNRNPDIDVANLKQRKRKTKAEREAYGEAYALARGHISSRDKAQIARSIARGDHLDSPQAVVGVNPTPIGDIGDDYLPTE